MEQGLLLRGMWMVGSPCFVKVTKASRFRAYHTGPEMVGGQADRLNSREASACLGLGWVLVWIHRQKTQQKKRCFFCTGEKEI